VDSADEGKIKRTFLLNQFLMRKEKFCWKNAN
jgi:hypothetical protein